jgi:hypothetical protein
MKIFQSLLTSSLISLLVDQTEGWSCLPPSPVKKIKDIGRKSFLIGAASGFVLGTTATAAGAAVAIDATAASNKLPYEPAAGSLADKVILITGGTAGLGLVRSAALTFLLQFVFCCDEICKKEYSNKSLQFHCLAHSYINPGIGKAIGGGGSYHCVDFPKRCQG